MPNHVMFQIVRSMPVRAQHNVNITQKSLSELKDACGQQWNGIMQQYAQNILKIISDKFTKTSETIKKRQEIQARQTEKKTFELSSEEEGNDSFQEDAPQPKKGKEAFNDLESRSLISPVVSKETVGFSKPESEK